MLAHKTTHVVQVEANGKTEPETQSSGRYHSEKACWLKVAEKYPALTGIKRSTWDVSVNKQGITPEAVYEANQVRIQQVYTERAPCSGCSPLLDEVLMNGTKVYWTFPYVSEATKKYDPSENREQEAFMTLAYMPTGEEPGEGSVKAERTYVNKALKKEVKQLTTGVKKPKTDPSE